MARAQTTRPKATAREHAPRPGRTAFLCEHRANGELDCRTRIFWREGDDEPECRTHGTREMKRQANRPYCGQPIPAE